MGFYDGTEAGSSLHALTLSWVRCYGELVTGALSKRTVLF